MGAYLGAIGAAIPTLSFTRCLPACTTFPRNRYRRAMAPTPIRCPTAPYRGAGRPESIYALERVVDEAARVTGIDPVKLRRRNLVKKSAFPYKTQVGTVIDSGDFEPILDKALELAGYDTFKQRRREAQKRGKYRGVGICCMLEHAGGSPTESALLEFPGNETLQLRLNVQNTGQGHATRVLAPDRRTARHCAGKNPAPPWRFSERAAGLCLGRFTLGHDGEVPIRWSRRSMPSSPKGKPIAATMLEAGEADIAYRNGSFEVVGTDRRVSLFEVATARFRDEKARRDRRGSRHQDGERDAANLPERCAYRRGRDRCGDPAICKS